MRTILFSILVLLSLFTEAQKTLQLQPAIPALLRNGDRMEFQLTIQNTGSKDQTGQAELQLTDAETGVSIDGWFQNVFPNQYFTAEAKQAAVASFPIEVPYQFFKKAAWRFIVRTPTDSLITNGSFPVLPVLKPFSKSALFSGAGNYTFPALLQSEASDTRQNAGLRIEVAASPAALVHAALAKQLDANSTTAIDLSRQLLAAEMLQQLAASNPAAFREISRFSSPELEATTSRLFARLVTLQQASGGFSLLAGGKPDGLVSWQVALNLARLQQLKTTLRKEQQNTLSKTFTYLQRNQQELPAAAIAYLELTADRKVSASKNQSWISASLSSQPLWVQAMTAVVLQRLSKAEQAAEVYQVAKYKQADLAGEAMGEPFVSSQSLMLEYALLINDQAGMEAFTTQVLNESSSHRHTTADAYALLLNKKPLVPFTNAKVQLGKLPEFDANSRFYFDTSIAGGLVQPALGTIKVGQQEKAPLLTRVIWDYVDESTDVQPDGSTLSRTWQEVKNGHFQPLTEGLRVAQGSQLELSIEINTAKIIKDMQLSAGIPAGFKPVAMQIQGEPGFVHWHLPTLQPGKHRFTCRIQAEHKGNFASGPVVLKQVGSEQEFVRVGSEQVYVE